MADNQRIGNRRYTVGDEVITIETNPGDFVPEGLVDAKTATLSIYYFLKPLGYVDYFQTELGEALGISRQTVNGAFQELEELELLDIAIEASKRGRSLYRIKTQD